MIYKHRKRKKKKMKKLLFISLLLACACSYASSKFGFNPTDNSIVLPDLARTIARWCIVPLVILVVGWAGLGIFPRSERWWDSFSWKMGELYNQVLIQSSPGGW